MPAMAFLSLWESVMFAEAEPFVTVKVASSVATSDQFLFSRFDPLELLNKLCTSFKAKYQFGL